MPRKPLRVGRRVRAGVAFTDVGGGPATACGALRQKGYGPRVLLVVRGANGERLVFGQVGGGADGVCGSSRIGFSGLSDERHLVGLRNREVQNGAPEYGETSRSSQGASRGECLGAPIRNTQTACHHTTKWEECFMRLARTTNLGDDVARGAGAGRGGAGRDQDLLRQPLRGHRRARQAQRHRRQKNEISGLAGPDYISRQAATPTSSTATGARTRCAPATAGTACSAAGAEDRALRRRRQRHDERPGRLQGRRQLRAGNGHGLRRQARPRQRGLRERLRRRWRPGARARSWTRSPGRGSWGAPTALRACG